MNFDTNEPLRLIVMAIYTLTLLYGISVVFSWVKKKLGQFRRGTPSATRSTEEVSRNDSPVTIPLRPRDNAVYTAMVESLSHTLNAAYPVYAATATRTQYQLEQSLADEFNVSALAAHMHSMAITQAIFDAFLEDHNIPEQEKVQAMEAVSFLSEHYKDFVTYAQENP